MTLTNDSQQRDASRYGIRFPDAAHVDQDSEYVEISEITDERQGPWESLRLHDYERIYLRPGLYEQLFAEVLCCTSPLRVAGLLASAVANRDIPPSDLRVIDVGAGNGMVGEELNHLGVKQIVGIDILVEAAKAAARDRPGLYADYLVADLTDLDERERERLTAIRPNCLITVAALGFGDIPPEAFATAFNLIETPGWVAFNIRDAFLRSDDKSGFARLIELMTERGYIEIEATQRYVHRKSVSGQNIEYVAFVARKLADLPSPLPSDLVNLKRLNHRYRERTPSSTTNGTIAIQFNQASKTYGGETNAVDDVSLQIAEGELLAIVGGSGSGKTTLLKMMNGLITPTSGSVSIGGRDLVDIDLIALRRSTGYVFQGVGLFPHLTVAENIAVVPKLLHMDAKQIDRRVHELLEMVGLNAATYANRMPSDLSGGERQRVGFARALAAKPRILLMDEPFGALDPVTRLSLQSQLIQIHRQLRLTSVLVTHDMAEALLLANRIAVMRGGRILRIGTPAELLAEPGDPYVESLLASPRQQAAQIDQLSGQ